MNKLKFLGPFVIILFLLAIVYLREKESKGVLEIILFFASFFILIIVLRYLQDIKLNFISSKLKQFSLINGHSYNRRRTEEFSNKINRSNYLLSEFEKNIPIWDCIEGLKDNYNFLMFHCTFEGKNRSENWVTAIQIPKEHNLPKIIISKTEKGKGQYRVIPFFADKNFIKLPLENSLSILVDNKEYDKHKDVIEKIISLKNHFLQLPLKSFQIEISKGNILIYFYDDIETLEQFNGIISGYVKLVENILKPESISNIDYSSKKSNFSRIDFKPSTDFYVDTGFIFRNKVYKSVIFFTLFIFAVLSLTVVTVFGLISSLIIMTMMVLLFRWFQKQSNKKIDKNFYFAMIFVSLMFVVFSQLADNYKQYNSMFPKEAMEKSVFGQISQYLINKKTDSREGKEVRIQEITLSNKNWKYALYFPQDFNQDKQYPLIVGLHGFGGNAKDYIKLWASDADKYGFIVTVLQAYPKEYPDGSVVESYPWIEINDFTKAVLEDIGKSYKIDTDRIFLTGHSAGASTSYIIALTSGIKFKGIIPIDGYLPLESGIAETLGNAKDLNFYVVHGAEDYEVSAVVEQEKILTSYGAKMEFKILPEMGHEYPLLEHENIIKWIKSLP